MKAKLVILFVLLISGFTPFAQTTAKNSYWVQLKDKKGTPFLISHPEAYLSQRAIARRTKQHIIIDETDLPVSPVYLDTLKKRGLEIVHTSKWLNGATVRTADTALIRKIGTLPFVTAVQLTKPGAANKSASQKFSEETSSVTYDPANYGNAVNQLTQLNGQYLHRQGYRGKGIQIAVLDVGFWHANQIAAFDSLFSTKRILGTHDFVNPLSDIYAEGSHGMSVLSCMGGNLPKEMTGTAPDASFYLIRTEDMATEYLIEEDNWVAGAEFADSVGVDVINSSLGYSEFNDPKMNHTYQDMNGKKTRSTQGANMAFQKGILVFVAAGNEGNTSWKYISAPSDGENVIAVGAVDKNGVRAAFSSIGPAYGGAIKPNVAAMGASAYLVTGNGVLGYSSGTSFASPVLAGMGACLLQANPWANVKQVKMAIEQSGAQFNTPDAFLGYGIPDFEKADNYLKINATHYLKSENNWAVSPNPFVGEIYLRNLNLASNGDCMIQIYNLQGVCLWQSTIQTSGTVILKNMDNLPEGFLILTISSGEKKEQFKLIKQGK